MPHYPSFEEQLASLPDEQKSLGVRLEPIYGIEGWLRLSEMVGLYQLVSSISTESPVICEIGSWKGKSSAVLAAAAQQYGGHVYCIDPFTGEGDERSLPAYQRSIQSMEGLSLRKAFEDTMQSFGFIDTITILPYLSEIARPLFPADHIDLLFIDGNHDYNDVKKDYLSWSELIPSGGFLALHDVGAKPIDGPRRVFHEFIETNSAWSAVHMIGEMGVATRA